MNNKGIFTVHSVKFLTRLIAVSVEFCIICDSGYSGNMEEYSVTTKEQNLVTEVFIAKLDRSLYAPCGRTKGHLYSDCIAAVLMPSVQTYLS